MVLRDLSNQGTEKGECMRCMGEATVVKYLVQL